MRFMRFARWGCGLLACAVVVSALTALGPVSHAAAAPVSGASVKPMSISEDSLTRSGNELLNLRGTEASAAAGYFEIRLRATGLCLGIAANGYAGTWNCTGNPDQQWTVSGFRSPGFAHWIRCWWLIRSRLIPESAGVRRGGTADSR
jgi:Ricin-type beta-trefoil lectin domain-like